LHKRLLALGLGSLVIVFGVCIGVATWMLREWPKPMVPVFVVGGALFVIYLIQGVAWVAISQKELASGVGGGGESAEERAIKRLVGLVLQVAVGLAALSTFAFWILPDVRVKALHVFKDRGAFYMIQALGDPSPTVVAAACQNLFAMSAVRYEPFIVDGLIRSPQAAPACLSWASERGYSGVVNVSSQLTRQWEYRLLTSAFGEAPEVCPLVDTHSQVSQIGELDNPIPFQMECTFSAPAGSVRACCGQQLIGQEYRLPTSQYPSEFATSYQGLVMSAFRPLDVGESDREISRQMNLISNASKQWVLELGCDLMHRESSRDVIRGLAPLVESARCDLPGPARVKFVQAAPWQDLCLEILEFSPQAEVESSLCNAFKTVLAKDSVAAASQALHAALNKFKDQQRAKELDDDGRGMAMVARQVAMSRRSRHEINSYIHAGSGHRDTHCKRSRLAGNSLQGPKIIEVYDTTDCDLGWPEGLTAEEIKREALMAVKEATKVPKTGGSNLVRSKDFKGKTSPENLKRAKGEMEREAQKR